MHVAICSDGVFPESVGGIQRHTRLLTETIARRHPAVRISVLHTHVGKRLFHDCPSVSEMAVEPRPGRRQYLLECLDLSERFADLLRGLADAVVYAQGISVVRGIREFSGRLIVNPHGLEAFQAVTVRDWAVGIPFRKVQRHTFRHARHVVSLGGRLTEILMRETPDADRRVVVLPNGVEVPDGASARAAAALGGPVRLLFVGRLAPNKGVPDLLAAIDELKRRGRTSHFHVDIVGGGPLLEPLRAQNRRPNVQFLGRVSDDQLEDLYRRADVFVLPTHFEGMPTVVLEAMARGLPVLVTDVGATRELVDDSNGRIIPTRDPGTLADAIVYLESLGSDGRSELGANGLERVRQRFTWDRVADRHVDLFAACARSAGLA